jgi:uncharacterized protein (DUF1501 family)
MKPFKLSRRSLIQGAAAGAASAALLGPGRALAQVTTVEKPAVLMIFLRGGYNALFGSADSFVATNTFNITSSNITDLGNGLVVDGPTFGAKLPAIATQHMSTIGIHHGLTSHDPAQVADFSDGTRSYPLMLANALGGTAPIKAAVLGSATPQGPAPTEGGISLQQITDLGSTIQALQGGAVDPQIPARAPSVAAITAARAMSATALQMNTASLKSAQDAYDTSLQVLQSTAAQFSYPTLAAAYGVSATSTGVSSFKMQMVAAEVMTLAGANVMIAVNDGWDTHGDTSGSTVRNKMNSEILPGLTTFLSRMLTASGRNVVVSIHGDFARSLPGSDHAGSLSGTVWGKYVKVGTTGHVTVPNNASGPNLPSGSPAVPQFFSYLAAVAKSPTNPFGTNPHALVL